MTVREHLEAILAVANRRASEQPYMSPEERLSCVEEHASKILDHLDKATRYRLSIEGQVHLPMRAIYDPEHPRD